MMHNYIGMFEERENYCVLRIDDKEYKLCTWDSLFEKKPWMENYIGKKVSIFGHIKGNALVYIGIILFNDQEKVLAKSNQVNII